jgi:hypothetical protein
MVFVDVIVVDVVDVTASTFDELSVVADTTFDELSTIFIVLKNKK